MVQKSTREKIVEAARKCFARKGFKGATTAEIAADAGFSEGTIYRHFNSKESLLMECVTPVLQEIIEELNLQVNGSEDERELTEKLLHLRLEIIRQHYDTFSIIFSEIHGNPDIMRHYVWFLRKQESKILQILDQVEEKVGIKRRRNYLLFGLGQVMALWLSLNIKEWEQQLSLESLPEMLQISEEDIIPDMADFVLYGISGVPENR